MNEHYPLQSQLPSLAGSTTETTSPSETSAARHSKRTGSTHPNNISPTERILSAIGGGALFLSGLSRGKLSGLAMSLVGGALAYRGTTGHCHVYEYLGMDTARHPEATAVPAKQGFKVHRSFTINRPREELFAFWRELENLPKVMSHLLRVDVIDSKKSRWVAETVAGRQVEWEAEIINEREPELIAWRSLPGGDLETAGSVHFRSLSHDRGTEVEISLKYNPPAGKLGATIAALFGRGLEHELAHDLRQFKSLMEAGEVPTTKGQPQGR